MKIPLPALLVAGLISFSGCESVPVRTGSPYAPPAAAPATSSNQLELANLREDVRILQQRVGELGLLVEQLNRQNRDLQDRADLSSQSYVTLAQMNQALADMNRSLNQGSAEQRREIVQQVTQQIERLAKETQAALDAMSRGMAAARPAAAPARTFSDDYPKQGVTYTVAPGDNLSTIARRLNSSVRDIQNANRLASDQIQVGQVLFVPQRN